MSPTAALKPRLADIVGAAHVHDDAAALALFAEDIGAGGPARQVNGRPRGL